MSMRLRAARAGALPVLRAPDGQFLREPDHRDHPQQQHQPDDGRRPDPRSRHDERLLARVASTRPSTIIRAVLSGYLMWLSVEYIVVPYRRSATVMGNSPIRYPSRMRYTS